MYNYFPFSKHTTEKSVRTSNTIGLLFEQLIIKTLLKRKKTSIDHSGIDNRRTRACIAITINCYELIELRLDDVNGEI